MKFAVVISILVSPLVAQSINCGGPAVSNGAYQSDAFFVGGTPFSKPSLGSPPLDTMRFGPTVTYHIPRDPGVYTVALLLVEPLYTAPGKRLMTIDVNGQRISGVDPFAIAVRQMKPFANVTVTTLAGTGSLNITLTSDIPGGNAIRSAIIVGRADTLLGYKLGAGLSTVAAIVGSGDQPTLTVDGGAFYTVYASRSPGPSGDCTTALVALVPGLAVNNFPRPFAVVAFDGFYVCGPDPTGPDKWIYRTVARW